MPRDRKPQPYWGQSSWVSGPAGGRHTRSNQGKKGGCLDSIVIFGGSVTGIIYGLHHLIG